MKETLRVGRWGGKLTAQSLAEGGDMIVVPPEPGRSLPVTLKAAAMGSPLAAWAEAKRAVIDEHLWQSGAVLFRGFHVDGLEDFRAFLQVAIGPLMNYTESATPRRVLAEQIYTSTEFPSRYVIALHNELSAARVFPGRISFFCDQPAERGGETPIADMRRVLARIPPEVRERFIEKGWMVVRNFGTGVGPTWQDAFHTLDKAEVETYCRESAIELQWRPGGCLRTRQVRTAVARHPVTRELAWFNHAAFWHLSSLRPEVRDGMQIAVAPEDMPYNTFYGDGEPIDDATVAIVREAYDAETVPVTWRKGDVLLLDNILAAHGRLAFEGTRRVLVGMGLPIEDRGVPSPNVLNTPWSPDSTGGQG